MPLDRDALAELSQYALTFRTRLDPDPFQAYLDRTLTDTATNVELSELAPTTDEARAMLAAVQAMSHRLHPTTFEWYLNLQELLLAVIGDVEPAGPLSHVVEANVALRYAEQQLRINVRDAHEAGHSWAAIGRTLGVSKQSAFERFA